MKSYKKIGIAIIALLFVFLSLFFGKKFFKSNKNSNNIEASSNEKSISEDKVKYVNKRFSIKENFPEKSQKLEFSDKKNFVTIPGRENIKEDDFGEYVDGEIFVDVDLAKFDEKIFDKYGAKIVGKCDTWGGYQINIPNKSSKELEKISEKIKKEKGVLIANLHRLIPIENEEFSYPEDNFKIKGKKFDKNNLWKDYKIDSGFEIDKDVDSKFLNEDPYWSYKITNLAYMWKNLDSKEAANVGVFENGIINHSTSDSLSKIKKDIDFEDLNSENLEDKNSKDKDDKKSKEDDNNKLHAYLVSSTLAAKHTNVGFSGVGKDVKVYPTIFDPSLLAYLISYRIDQSQNKIKIFNISWGYDAESLYYINANKKDIKKDFKKGKLSKIINNNEKINSKNVEEYAKNIKNTHKNSTERLNLSLKKLKENKKDFLLVKSAGNQGDEIRGIERFSNVKINKTSILNDIDKDLKSRLIIVGAASPNLKHDKKLTFANFSTTRNVDIVAPGEKVPGYYQNGKFKLWNGTSVSAAFVSGLAANIYGAYPDKMNGELAKELIVNSGTFDVIDEFNGENSKLVDAKKITELAKKKIQDKKEEKKGKNKKIIRENKSDESKEGNLRVIENEDSSTENSGKNDYTNLNSENSYKIIQDGKDQGEISILDMGDVQLIDVGKLNEIYLKDSSYFIDPKFSDIKNKFYKKLEENQGKYIKENSDGSYYFGLFPENIDNSENNQSYAYQYFPEYGVFSFAKKDYMKEESVYFLNNKFAGIISDDKLYVEADWLSWWFGFDTDFSIDTKNKIIKYNRQGHDFGQEGVDYISIPTENYNNIYELLEDNFAKLN